MPRAGGRTLGRRGAAIESNCSGPAPSLGTMLAISWLAVVLLFRHTLFGKTVSCGLACPLLTTAGDGDLLGPWEAADVLAS